MSADQGVYPFGVAVLPQPPSASGPSAFSFSVPIRAPCTSRGGPASRPRPTVEGPSGGRRADAVLGWRRCKPPHRAMASRRRVHVLVGQRLVASVQLQRRLGPTDRAEVPRAPRAHTSRRVDHRLPRHASSKQGRRRCHRVPSTRCSFGELGMPRAALGPHPEELDIVGEATRETLGSPRPRARRVCARRDHHTGLRRADGAVVAAERRTDAGRRADGVDASATTGGRATFVSAADGRPCGRSAIPTSSAPSMPMARSTRCGWSSRPSVRDWAGVDRLRQRGQKRQAARR